ncbi:MAG: multidrug effflux MFS transporter [Sandaracinaceae bacterium]
MSSTPASERLSLAPQAPVAPDAPAARADSGPGSVELVAMVASLMAMNALAIDVMLPGLPAIARHFDVVEANHQQFVIFAYIVGFGVPQLFWGPLTDRYGRRNALFVALGGYALASGAAIFASNFAMFLALRFLQGVFAAGCRVIAVALVRDLYAGPMMARTMSLVMTVFMVVPITAPMIGQAILAIAPWQATFGLLAVVGVLVLVWSFTRLAETLPADSRNPISVGRIARNYWMIVTTPVTLGYMVASGLLFGALFAFIPSSEQIFREVFHQGDTFVYWFAAIAFTLSLANFANSRLVRRFGMRRIGHAALIGFTVLSFVLYVAMRVFGERLEIFFPLFALAFALFGLIGANFSALAMEPLGKVAGTGSAAYGFATTTVSGAIGAVIGLAYDGSTAPLLLGFVALGVCSLLAVIATERGKFLSRPAEVLTQKGGEGA